MLEYMCVYAYLRVSATSATRHLHVHVHRRGRMDIGRAFGSVHTRVCVSVRGRALAGCVCVHVRAFGGVCVRVYAFFVRARASACMRACAFVYAHMLCVRVRVRVCVCCVRVALHICAHERVASVCAACSDTCVRTVGRGGRGAGTTESWRGGEKQVSVRGVSVGGSGF